MTINTLKKMALIEGTTLILLLFIAVPLKRLAEMPEAVSVLGPIHGAAFIPLGSFIFEREILEKNNS